MADYKVMYTKLFNKVTDIINVLQAAQVETEGMYIDHEPTIHTLIKPEADKEE